MARIFIHGQLRGNLVEGTDAIIPIAKKGTIKARSNQNVAEASLGKVLNNHRLKIDFGLNDGGLFFELIIDHGGPHVRQSLLDGLNPRLIFQRENGTLAGGIGSNLGHAFGAWPKIHAVIPLQCRFLFLQASIRHFQPCHFVFRQPNAVNHIGHRVTEIGVASIFGCLGK